MGKGASSRTGKGRRFPRDILLTSLVAVMAFSAFALADLALLDQFEEIMDEYYPTDHEPVFEYVEEEYFNIDGYTSEGSSSDLDLGQLPINTSKMRAELTWSDDIGSNDILGVALFFNGTELISSEDSSGAISLESEDGLYNGTYGVKVTAVDCPGMVDPIPVDRDNGNDWNLKVFVTVRYDVGG